MQMRFNGLRQQGCAANKIIVGVDDLESSPGGKEHVMTFEYGQYGDAFETFFGSTRTSD